ncbi:hypothetical protein PMAYCL1PPCAC_22760, partial [Pristionchus mayeri]
KTFHRSRGWLIAQIVITMLCWLVGALSLQSIASRPQIVSMLDGMKMHGVSEAPPVGEIDDVPKNTSLFYQCLDPKPKTGSDTPCRGKW